MESISTSTSNFINSNVIQSYYDISASTIKSSFANSYTVINQVYSFYLILNFRQ